MNKWLALILLVLFFAFFFFIYQEKKGTHPTTKEEIPTFFFHGYAGTKNSFKGMIQRLEKEEQAKLTTQITVTKDGKLKIKSKKKSNKRPLIQVIFADNKSGISNQEKWITSVLTWGKQHGMTKVNIIGHSMGGVSSLQTLLSEPKDTLPEVVHFISLGANFNGFETQEATETVTEMLTSGPRKQTGFFQQLQQNLHKFPKETQWLSIGGLLEKDQPNQGDGTVPLNSALGLHAFAVKNHLHHQYVIVEGPLAQHSMLHENPEVDKLVAKFLWEKK